MAKLWLFYILIYVRLQEPTAAEQYRIPMKKNNFANRCSLRRVHCNEYKTIGHMLRHESQLKIIIEGDVEGYIGRRPQGQNT